MISVDVQFDSKRAERLIRELEKVSENITKELGVVSHKAGRKVESLLAKEVNTHVAVKQKDVKRDIYVKKLRPVGARITLNKTNRMSLKRFNPRHTKGGVTYRISKGKPRQKLPHAFMGPNPTVTSVKLGQHVFQRQGKARLPIAKKRGPSAAGVISTHPERLANVAKLTRRHLRKEMVRRIRYRRLKLEGTL